MATKQIDVNTCTQSGWNVSEKDRTTVHAIQDGQLLCIARMQAASNLEIV